MKQIAHRLSRIVRLGAEDLWDWVVPPSCSYCGSHLEAATPVMLCPSCCHDLVSRIGNPCRRCGMPLGRRRPDDCCWCLRNRHQFSATVALGAYEGALRQAVVRAKHDAWEPLARALAALLSEKLLPFVEDWNVDAIIPIPSHWRRRWKRSTNVAEVLAETIGRTLQRPTRRGVLRCQRLAGKQGTLTPRQRRKNVRGVYRIGRADHIAGKNVLLVDDVMTTGATTDEATRVLLQADAARVFVAVVARGIGQRPAAGDDSDHDTEDEIK
jgi:ComF family protein